MIPELWHNIAIGNESYSLMNLDHPYAEKIVIEEIDAGIDVYYDRRWKITETLTSWLSKNLQIVRDKNVLILGAGVGAETLVLGRYAKHIWINDLAPAALKLCSEQLAHNNIHNYTPLLGRYEDLDLPEVDLVVGSFLIYNEETFTAMRSFTAAHKGDIILVNERLDPFPEFLQLEEHSIIFDEKEALGILLKRKMQL